jgi:hypothetical protein
MMLMVTMKKMMMIEKKMGMEDVPLQCFLDDHTVLTGLIN